jgi:hypothetical protein
MNYQNYTLTNKCVVVKCDNYFRTEGVNYKVMFDENGR